MWKLLKRTGLFLFFLWLSSCSIDPFYRHASWAPTNTPDKNLQAMLANPNDWNEGRHDPEQLSPMAVEAVKRFRENKVPALPEDGRGFKPVGGN